MLRDEILTQLVANRAEHLLHHEFVAGFRAMGDMIATAAAQVEKARVCSQSTDESAEAVMMLELEKAAAEVLAVYLEARAREMRR